MPPGSDAWSQLFVTGLKKSPAEAGQRGPVVEGSFTPLFMTISTRTLFRKIPIRWSDGSATPPFGPALDDQQNFPLRPSRPLSTGRRADKFAA